MKFEPTTSNIKALLKGVNLRKLAEKSGVAITTIENWCYRETQPTAMNLFFVLDAAGYELSISKKEGVPQ